MAILKPTGEILFQGATINEFSAGYNFKLAISQGIDAAILRATAGSNYTDPRFAVAAQRAQEAGMRLGFYHYLIAENAQQARAQARFFASAISKNEYQLRPSMRFEAPKELSNSQANLIALAFLSEVQNLMGVAPAVYTDAEAARTLWSRTVGASFPLWVIDEQDGEGPDASPSPWSGWTGWQYRRTSDENCLVSGIPVSRFTADMLTQGSDAPPEVDSTKFICITVAPGDTLSGIARLFNTTVSSIVTLNEIADPNRIFPGQRLFLQVAETVPYPCCDVYTVKRGDTLSAIGKRFGVDWQHIASINEISDPNRIFPGQVLKLGLCD